MGSHGPDAKFTMPQIVLCLASSDQWSQGPEWDRPGACWGWFEARKTYSILSKSRQVSAELALSHPPCFSSLF